ncbi:MAG: Cytidylate kinase [Candidatus Omnitrophica bacterium]|nr:Cytidylate kinase [Candidatus Omnitrophota bacterium]
MPPKLIIAIDGPAGSGKSSTAKALAKRLKVPFIDTGAMYRACTLKAMRLNIDLSDKRALIRAAKSARIRLAGTDPLKQRVYLDGKDVTRDIRQPELTRNVFYVAQEPVIRRHLVRLQQAMGRRSGGVMEGRDIGTVVFPDADLKLFFKANDRIRARRRLRELAAAGKKATLAEVLRDIRRRDKTDYRRTEGPLRQAKDAIAIDTSDLTIDETVDIIVKLINPKKNPAPQKGASFVSSARSRYGRDGKPLRG